MDTKLQNDIMESIKRNLPEQVAGQLKVVLEEYEELKAGIPVIIPDHKKPKFFED
jgi:hypothetical protein